MRHALTVVWLVANCYGCRVLRSIHVIGTSSCFAAASRIANGSTTRNVAADRITQLDVGHPIAIGQDRAPDGVVTVPLNVGRTGIRQPTHPAVTVNPVRIASTLQFHEA